ncbi:hypothetical protein SAY86_020794 [Trapa natans]|uniref:Uncharacterized protein n=1 Tax=Trapa natans TaxID=22666 RepID=A0AAN7M8P6_TRANT|nr:hypothetical protein SAY86_020794 [Trapa natans]
MDKVENFAHVLSAASLDKKIKLKFTKAWLSFLWLSLPLDVYKEEDDGATANEQEKMVIDIKPGTDNFHDKEVNLIKTNAMSGCYTKKRIAL